MGGSSGYGRPGYSPGGRGSYSYGSSGDRAYSRQGSASALERYRAGAEAARRGREQPAPVPLPPPTAGTTGRERWGLPPARPRYDHRPDYGRGYGTDWYRDRGWSPGGFGGGVLGGLGGRSFGIWDGLFLGFLLDNLTRAGSLDFFRNHRDDPGLREWRAEADRLARDNAELREKLDRLDRELGGRSGEQPGATPPRDPNYLPPDVPPEVALAPAPGNDARTPTAERPAPAGDGGGGGLWLPLLLVGGAGVAFLSWRRGRQGGAGAGGGGAQGPLGSAGAILRRKLGGERYAPSLFRVGMTLTVDPTPFILAGDAIKVPAPVSAGAAGGGERVSVAEVGRVEGGDGGLRAAPPAGAARLLPAPPRRGRPAGRVPVLRADRRGLARERGGVGRLARSGGRHDRLAGIPDQGRQGLRSRLVARRGARRAAAAGGVDRGRGGRAAHGAQPGDALRGADGGGGAGAADRVHPGCGGGGGGAGLGGDQRGDRREPGDALARLTNGSGPREGDGMDDGGVIGILFTGLPVLLAQFAVTLALLGLGVACYTALTPFHERELVRAGNTAAGIVLGGNFVALAIPLAATLATSLVVLDIIVWGLVALALQLVAFVLAARLIPGLREMIETGNTAAACMLVGVQVAVALLNAGAMAG